jgi:hypothetical protein
MSNEISAVSTELEKSLISALEAAGLQYFEVEVEGKQPGFEMTISGGLEKFIEAMKAFGQNVVFYDPTILDEDEFFADHPAVAIPLKIFDRIRYTISCTDLASPGMLEWLANLLAATGLIYERQYQEVLPVESGMPIAQRAERWVDRLASLRSKVGRDSKSNR